MKEMRYMKLLGLTSIVILFGIAQVSCEQSGMLRAIASPESSQWPAGENEPAAATATPYTARPTAVGAAASASAPAPPTPSSDPFLAELAVKTWTYLSSDWARSNHLPWSWRSETMSGGDFANTAEIGFLALSWLAAYDMAQPWQPSWVETEAEVTAILDQLRAWQTGSQSQQPHGPNAYENSVFYQWYWISWEPPVVSGNLDDRLVPSIDNAWLAASLIVIREYAVAHGHGELQQKADAILQDMDFMLWYFPDFHLFSWGDVENPQGDFLADYYSNENRIINFMARALSQMSREEYQASLEALLRPEGVYNDVTVAAMAWDGSYFTYGGPALFIREMETAYGVNTILPAAQAQIAYAADQGYEAWGLSDCYDVGDGGYVQQGAPPAGLAQPETRPGLVTAHASALALITPLAAEATANLQMMADTYSCAYDSQYGFRDAVMANPAAPDYGQCSNAFSSLNQEWIFLSLANHHNGFIWRYFYSHTGVRQAHAEMFDAHTVFLPIVQR
jgi:hypothetical protein